MLLMDQYFYKFENGKKVSEKQFIFKREISRAN